MDSYKLVKDCLRNQLSAQRQLYELHAPPMLGVCYRYTKSIADAEDVLQEGFIKVLRTCTSTKAMASWVPGYDASW